MNKPNTQVASCETTHTPTPYHIERSCGRYEIWPKDNGQVHTFVGIAQREVDAQFITKAVNCHDDLLSACSRAYYSLCKVAGTESEYRVMASELLIESLKKALAKAQGNPL